MWNGSRRLRRLRFGIGIEQANRCGRLPGWFAAVVIGGGAKVGVRDAPVTFSPMLTLLGQPAGSPVSASGGTEVPSGEQPGSDREEYSGQRGYRTQFEGHIAEIAT